MKRDGLGDVNIVEWVCLPFEYISCCRVSERDGRTLGSCAFPPTSMQENSFVILVI